MTEEKALQERAKFEVPAMPFGAESEEMQEEMEGLEFSFINVRIPSGGGLAFELPTDDEEPELIRELTGVIVHHHPVNAYWSTEYEGQNDPPDCSSLDGKIGIGSPGGACKSCPLNQWGSSEDGKGKVCNNRRRIYLLREGEMFPIVISLPPTSLRNFSDFITRKILQGGLLSWQAISTVKLKKASSSTGIEFSQAVWKLEQILDDESAATMKEYSNKIKELARTLSVEDVEASQNSDEDEITI